MGIEVFNRFERKFILDHSTYQRIQRELFKYMELDNYNQNHEFYTISNVYYDTKDDYLICNSLSKPKYKEKLRLRAYGAPKEEEKVYLEIKKKFYGRGNKRRTTLKLKEAYDFVDTGIKPDFKPYMNKQVIDEIEYIIKLYDLEPKLYLAYDRRALFSKKNKDLRITFDKNIRTRRYDLKLESGDYGEQLLQSNQWLMEIKTENSIPIWLSQLLSKNKIYKTSFSKYGTEYKKMLSRDMKLKGEIKICSKQYLTQPQLVPQYL